MEWKSVNIHCDINTILPTQELSFSTSFIILIGSKLWIFINDLDSRYFFAICLHQSLSIFFRSLMDLQGHPIKVAMFAIDDHINTLEWFYFYFLFFAFLYEFDTKIGIFIISGLLNQLNFHHKNFNLPSQYANEEGF